MVAFWKRNASSATQRKIAATAASLGVPPRALQILYSNYFDLDDERGWVKSDVTRADFAEAKAAGLMFDPLQMDHDELIAWILAGRDRTSREAVTQAFLASLENRRQDLRSALGSYAHVLHLKPHAFQAAKRGKGCAVCGAKAAGNHVDRSSCNFRRILWAGNIEQGELEYLGHDLHAFADLPLAIASPAALEHGRAFLESIRALPATARLSALASGTTGAFPSDKSQRQVALEILGYAGILKPAGTFSFFDSWVPPERVDDHEWKYPTCRWSGNDGVHEPAVSFWFPELKKR